MESQYQGSGPDGWAHFLLWGIGQLDGYFQGLEDSLCGGEEYRKGKAGKEEYLDKKAALYL